VGAADKTAGDDGLAGAGADREIGATDRGPRENTVAGSGRRVGSVSGGSWHDDDPWPRKHPGPLKSAPNEVCWARFFGPPDVVPA